MWQNIDWCRSKTSAAKQETREARAEMLHVSGSDENVFCCTINQVFSTEKQSGDDDHPVKKTEEIIPDWALSVSLKDSLDGHTSCVKLSAQSKCYSSLYFRPVIHLSEPKEIRDKKKRQATLTDGRFL